jgi:hypothetical protein
MIHSAYDGFSDDWNFQTGYYGKIEAIIRKNAQYFVSIRVSESEQDMKQATDFVVAIDGGEIAVRIRRSNCKFRDMTIRSKKRVGKTEIDKIREGWARYYLYCWTNANDEISEWIFVDLNKVREAKLLDNQKDISNGDGTYFVAIPFNELLTSGCIISKS